MRIRARGDVDHNPRVGFGEGGEDGGEQERTVYIFSWSFYSSERVPQGHGRSGCFDGVWQVAVRSEGGVGEEQTHFMPRELPKKSQ